MGRPPGPQWQPLGLDADPVPGDPPAIRAEAAHLASVARTSNGQIAAMRKIASDDTEVGLHAEKIRSAAHSLTGSLQAVSDRYVRVSAALSGWVADLEQAQSLSVRALNEAEAPYARLSQPAILPAGPGLTATQKQEIASYHSSVQRAQDQLDLAKALLARAVNLRDTQGAHYAAQINQASNDSLTDHESLWGDITSGFDHLVHAVSWEIRDTCTVLEVAATVAGIAAFVIAQFIPGLDVAVDALVLDAFLATGVAAGGRAALAMTGNGAWRVFAKSAYTSELLTDIAADGPRAAMLSKWAAQVGNGLGRDGQPGGRVRPEPGQRSGTSGLFQGHGQSRGVRRRGKQLRAAYLTRHQVHYPARRPESVRGIVENDARHRGYQCRSRGSQRYRRSGPGRGRVRLGR
jgi:hypothetical protein